MHRAQRGFLIAGILIPILFGSQPIHAQYTTDHQTNIISGVTSNWSGDYFVGSNTFANALLIRNGGVLTNADGHVGYTAASSSNSVVIAGTGSVWSNANMYLGDSGGANTLVISNAGRIASSQGVSIANTTTSSSNRVLVAGTNSVWNCGYIFSLGVTGSVNSLVISNGGQVISLYGVMGVDLTSSGNRTVITGAGSVWSNVQGSVIGHSGSDNQLTINKGAQLYSYSATIGLSGFSSNNSILVSDNGSLWDDSPVTSEIHFGADGSGNSLIVSNGGQVLGYYAYFGTGSTSSNNSALVTGPGSGFSVNCYIYTGYQGHDNMFTAANGATVADKFCYIGYTAGSSHNSVLITGTNTSWQNSYSVMDGFDGAGGNLTVSNGASLRATEHGVLGYSSFSHDNRAQVTSSGSVWNCTLNMTVGYDGQANRLVIDNGGRVINDYGFLGTDPGSNSNNVMVVGAGSVWTNTHDVNVGYSGAANSLVISNGGQVIAQNGWLAVDTNSCNNRVVVAGAGSVWSNATGMFVGYFGPGNSLEIRDGGLVDDYWGILGEQDSSSNNSVYVESGGVWRNQQLAVGDLGSHNALFVDGGSVFVTTYMAVGYSSLYCNNLVQLDSGQVVVTNAAGSAVLEVYAGSFVQLDGTLRVDTLVVTNPCAQFMHIGGTLIYKTLVLDPNADADVDGIPNNWEQAHGLDPLNPLDAEADSDGDGMSNLQEYLAGTNPTNCASAFRITSVTLTNNNALITWRTAGGRTNIVQALTYRSGSYADLSSNVVIVGSGDVTTNYLDVGGATNQPCRFYRIRLVP